MRTRTLVALACVVGCHDSDSHAVSDPRCTEKVAELRPWLEQLEIERASHEIDVAYPLQVIARPPHPIGHRIDAVEIKATTIAAFDASESDRASSTFPDQPTQAELEAKLAQMFAAVPDAATTHVAPADLRIDVAPDARWGDVVRVVAAAAKAGYPQATFAFTATSTLVPPLGVEPTTTSPDVIERADRRIEELRTQCAAWGRAVRSHTWVDDRIANAKAVARETADAIAACNCAANPDEVRVLAWTDAHWHQARVRVPITVRISGDAPMPIVAPAQAPWSDAHTALLAVAPDANARPVVTLVAH